MNRMLWPTELRRHMCATQGTIYYSRGVPKCQPLFEKFFHFSFKICRSCFPLPPSRLRRATSLIRGRLVVLTSFASFASAAPAAKALSLRCSSSPHHSLRFGGDPNAAPPTSPSGKKAAALTDCGFSSYFSADQYMPSMPAGAAGAGGSGLSATRDSVVSTIAETEAAFSRAERVTFAGSMMPHSTMLQYSSL